MSGDDDRSGEKQCKESWKSRKLTKPPLYEPSFRPRRLMISRIAFLSICADALRMACEHFDSTSALVSRPVKWRAVSRAPVCTGVRLLVKMWEMAFAISAAVTWSSWDGGQRRLRRGVM